MADHAVVTGPSFLSPVPRRRNGGTICSSHGRQAGRWHVRDRFGSWRDRARGCSAGGGELSDEEIGQPERRRRGPAASERLDDRESEHRQQRDHHDLADRIRAVGDPRAGFGREHPGQNRYSTAAESLSLTSSLRYPPSTADHCTVSDQQVRTLPRGQDPAPWLPSLHLQVLRQERRDLWHHRVHDRSFAVHS